MKSRELAANSPFEVQNQASSLVDYNLYTGDQAARDVAESVLDESQLREIERYGEVLGDSEVLHAGRLANIHEPELKRFDRFGHRIDQVEYHPSYHRLMELAIAEGGHCEPWEDQSDGRYVSRALKMMLHHQVEQGTSCPVTMTFAAVPSLRMQPEIAEEWIPRILSRTYDPRFCRPSEKQGVLLGMAMTERQGGSDVRSNATKAVPDGAGGPGALYRITGHKWFCSAPMSDAFLTLAQTEAGLSCFLIPRILPDGTRNGLDFQRLKDKLGNRSNASSEVEFREAYGRLVHEEGRGVATIIEMVRHTRLDCAIGAASLIRRCTAEALHHASERYVFSKRLIEQPLMQNVLADMCLESEAATVSALELSSLYEEADGDDDIARLARLATAVVKYWSTKRETVVAREALECLGGNGFIEESPMPRLFRESPLNSVWEGSGNVQCLDVLRAIQRDPGALELFVQYVRKHVGDEPAVNAALSEVVRALSAGGDGLEAMARIYVERLALVFQAASLKKFEITPSYDLFIRSRLKRAHGSFLGTLECRDNFSELIARNMPGHSGA